MKHVIKTVKDWENTSRERTLNTFQLEAGDQHLYSGRLFGFSHGTNAYGFEQILHSGKILSSFNIREAQKASRKNPTGGDRKHDGQYTVYFRFVEKRMNRTDSGIPAAIVRSLGGVGSGSGYVLFVSLNKIVQSGTCFALAGDIDGLKGVNCFDRKLAQNPLKKPIDIGKIQFELGLQAAETGSRNNEIGFFNSVSINDVEIIMICNCEKNKRIPNYTHVTNFKKSDRTTWEVFLRNDSTLNFIP